MPAGFSKTVEIWADRRAGAVLAARHAPVPRSDHCHHETTVTLTRVAENCYHTIYTHTKTTLFHQPEEGSFSLRDTPVTRNWSYSAPT